LHRGQPVFLEAVRRQYLADFVRFAQSPSFLLYELWDHLIDNYLTVHKKFEERVEQVQTRLIGDVDERVFGEFAAVVPRYRVDTSCQRMQRVDDGSRDRPGLAVGYAPDSGEAGLSVNQGDQAGGSLANDGVTLPVADAPTCLDARWPLSKAATVKALALPGGSAAVASSSLAPAQVLPQRATLPAIMGNVLVDAFATDRHLPVAGDLVGTPVLAKAILHLQPCRLANAWQAAGGVPPMNTRPVRRARLVVALRARIAPQLATDGAVGSAHFTGDLPEWETCLLQPLNLVAFVLAQVCVAHVQFHLAVKPRRLPHLRHLNGEGAALQS
jgi:hypothetical protein